MAAASLGLAIEPAGAQLRGDVAELVADACPAVAATPFYSIAYGPVQLDGVDAPVGTVVEALSPRGDVVGCHEVTTSGHYGAMFVYGEDATTDPPLPGMRAGEKVSFRVGGVAASASPELVWQSDRDLHRIVLEVTSPAECYGLTAGVDPPSSGAVTANPLPNCGAALYHSGTVVMLTASASPGWAFIGWSGDLSGSTNPASLTVSGDASVTAHFVPENVGPLVYYSHAVDDDASGQSEGDGDGVAECGEILELYVVVQNQGMAATDVLATLSTTSQYVAWPQNTASTYPDIETGGTGVNDDDFEVAIDPGVPDGQSIQLVLEITASNSGPWSSHLDLAVTCPGNRPPYVPGNPVPADGAGRQELDPELRWEGGDPDPDDSVTYDVYLRSAGAGPEALVCAGLTRAACCPGDLAHSTSYSWRVVATDSYGAVTAGPTWSFSTRAPATDAFRYHLPIVHNSR